MLAGDSLMRPHRHHPHFAGVETEIHGNKEPQPQLHSVLSYVCVQVESCLSNVADSVWDTKR